MSEIGNKIKEVLKDNGLKYQMMESWTWFKELGFSPEKLCQEVRIHNFNTCHRTKYRNI